MLGWQHKAICFMIFCKSSSEYVHQKRGFPNSKAFLRKFIV